MRWGAALSILFFVFAPAAHAACGLTQSAVSGAAPLKGTFRATCTSTVYSWNLGDGATAVGQTVTHTFRPGRWQPALQTDAGAEPGRPVTSIALRLSAPRVARYAQYVVLRASVVPRLPVMLRGRRFGLHGKLRVRVLAARPWVATAGGVSASARTRVMPVLTVSLRGEPIVAGSVHVVSTLHPASAGGRLSGPTGWTRGPRTRRTSRCAPVRRRAGSRSAAL